MRTVAALRSAVALVSIGVVGLGNASPGNAPTSARDVSGMPSSAVLDLDGASARRLSRSRYQVADRSLAAISGTFVASLGDFKTKINRNIRLTYRFAPSHIEVDRGDRVTFVNAARLQEPHTITIARKSELPTNIEEIFDCGAPESACAPARGHNSDNLKLEDDNDGERGLDGVGDSLFQRGNRSISRRVTASSGTRLHYVCAIHPWMQGHIKVN
jgi:plastocyanin